MVIVGTKGSRVSLENRVYFPEFYMSGGVLTNYIYTKNEKTKKPPFC